MDTNKQQYFTVKQVFITHKTDNNRLKLSLDLRKYKN